MSVLHRFSGTEEECSCLEPADFGCHPICCPAWLQVMETATTFRVVAYHSYRPYPDESLVEERTPQPDARTSPEGAIRPDQIEGGVDGQHHLEGLMGSVRKKRSAGHRPAPQGRTTGIHPVAADARTAAAFRPFPGRARDVPEVRKPSHRPAVRRERLPLLMDRAYEGNGHAKLRRNRSSNRWFLHPESGLTLGHMTGDV